MKVVARLVCAVGTVVVGQSVESATDAVHVVDEQVNSNDAREGQADGQNVETRKLDRRFDSMDLPDDMVIAAMSQPECERQLAFRGLECHSCEGVSEYREQVKYAWHKPLEYSESPDGEIVMDKETFLTNMLPHLNMPRYKKARAEREQKREHLNKIKDAKLQKSSENQEGGHVVEEDVVSDDEEAALKKMIDEQERLLREEEDEESWQEQVAMHNIWMDFAVKLMNGDIQTNGNQIIYKPPGMLSEEEQAEQSQEQFWERVYEYIPWLEHATVWHLVHLAIILTLFRSMYQTAFEAKVKELQAKQCCAAGKNCGESKSSANKNENSAEMKKIE